MKLEKRNAYICKKCRHVTLVVHIDEGVTPMMIRCENCGEIAISFMYRIPPPLMVSFDGSLLPTKEWFNDGGDQLKLRDRTDAKPVMVEYGNDTD
ncbi:MAG TPA: hypothetical protein ENO18_06910 [Caldithrix sp.]|nr:hypothetical protein [Caldithrix sp.]